MKRKIMLAVLCAAMCMCIASCGKDRSTQFVEEKTIMELPDTSDVVQNDRIEGEIITEDTPEDTPFDEIPETLEDSEKEIVVNEIVNYDLYSCTTDTVRLRSQPSTESEVIQTLGRKTVLKVAGIDENNWAQVQTESGEEGYVSADYILDPVSEEEWIAYQEQVANQKIVCIDAGHQAHGNNDQEPIGPGATETKAKVSGGTRGVSTGKMEYELTLEIALKLQAELEQRGYTVIMCRTTNDIDISNAERAAVANDAGADAFIRIHADGAENSATQGAHTICQTSSNRYNGQLHAQSLRLSQCVISEYVAMTGAKQIKADDGVDERDDLSGINWCSVPVTLIELGFMTNPTEDTLMSSADYQTKMVMGIANGIDRYFE